MQKHLTKSSHPRYMQMLQAHTAVCVLVGVVSNRARSVSFIAFGFSRCAFGTQSSHAPSQVHLSRHWWGHDLSVCTVSGVPGTACSVVITLLCSLMVSYGAHSHLQEPMIPTILSASSCVHEQNIDHTCTACPCQRAPGLMIDAYASSALSLLWCDQCGCRFYPTYLHEAACGVATPCCQPLEKGSARCVCLSTDSMQLSLASSLHVRGS